MYSMTSEAIAAIRVDLGPRTYDICVTSGLGDPFGRFVRNVLDASWAGRSCRSALIVTDENLARLPRTRAHGEAFEGLGIEVARLVIPAGEGAKSLGQASALYDRLIDLNADRHTLVVAIGGGVVGDLAGFVAATYARGLPLFMIPTTLLAQVDSSVGGKVGVNHPKAKNIIGAFHQPCGVWIDTETLTTLPDRELRCGLAEVVKYGVILDAEFFDFVEANAEAILDREPEPLRRIIARSCALKAQVVSADEREETGLRAVLNFGHTIGHAIESVAGYSGRFQHGEAVAVGMVAECRLAERLGWLIPPITERITRLLERLGLPISAPGLDPDLLLSAMGKDKKNRRGKIRFVLPKELGFVELTDEPDEADIRAILTTL
jgi:3-dehydroquinate synthase